MEVLIKNFNGLVTNIGDAPVGSAAYTRNFVRNKMRGWLSASKGYAQKFFDDTATGLPQTTDNAGDNYLDPAIHKISNLA